MQSIADFSQQSQPHQGNLSSGTLSPQNQGTLHQMLLNNQPQPQQMAAHHIAPHQHAAPLHQQPAPVHQQNPGLLTSNQHPAPLQHQVVPLQQNPAPLQDQVAPLHQQPAPPHQQIDAQHHIAPHQQPVPHPDFLHPAVVALLTITPETETDEIQHMIREAAAVLHAHHQKQCGRAVARASSIWAIGPGWQQWWKFWSACPADRERVAIATRLCRLRPVSIVVFAGPEVLPDVLRYNMPKPLMRQSEWDQP